MTKTFRLATEAARFPTEKSSSSNIGRHRSDRNPSRRVLRFHGGGGSNDFPRRVDRELVLGKDRELVHFAIDLKWVWGLLTNKLTYINFAKASWRGIRSLAGVTNGGKEFREIAVDILRYIRSVNSESTIKLFLGNIKMAEWLAANTDRLILVYIEDGSTKRNFECCVSYRRALSDPLLGDFINDKVFISYPLFVFSTSELIEFLRSLCSMQGPINTKLQGRLPTSFLSEMKLLWWLCLHQDMERIRMLHKCSQS